jgi:hypothetical protein
MPRAAYSTHHSPGEVIPLRMTRIKRMRRAVKRNLKARTVLEIR